MIISRQADLLLSSLLPDPEAARWQHVFPSFITSINGAFLRDMQNSRRSLYGISRLKHPVNLAYEAATADLNDINMIDPFHLEAYGETTVNYNRDVEIFPVLNTIFEKIYGESPYKSPTDMGVNMAGNCICDDEACREASKQEIIRRYFDALNALAKGSTSEKEAQKIELLMNMAGITVTDRKVVIKALERAKETDGRCRS